MQPTAFGLLYPALFSFREDRPCKGTFYRTADKYFLDSACLDCS
jgi:hypothetical protein